MTKKTRAAVAFANDNGYYSPTLGEYEPKYATTSKPSGYGSSLADSLVKQAREDRNAYAERLGAVKADRESLMTIVMNLLGVADQYEDTVDEQVGFSGYVSRVVTQTAAQKFAVDLRAAQHAIDGEAALKRLRKAVKTVQKEQSK